MNYSYFMRVALMIVVVTTILSGANAQEKWSPVSPVYQTVKSDISLESAVAADESGRVIVAWFQANGIAVAKSDDGGITYSVPVLQPFEVAGQQVRGVDLELSYAGDGVFVRTWILSYITLPEGTHQFVAYVSRSTDSGSTWSVPDPLPAIEYDTLTIDVAASPESETILITTASWITRSKDRGVTWQLSASPVTPGIIPGDQLIPGTINHIAAAPGGVWLHSCQTKYYRPTDEAPYASFNVAYLSLSKDNGETWQNVWVQRPDDTLYINDLHIDANEAVALIGISGNTYALHSTDGGVTWPAEGFGRHISGDLFYLNYLGLARTPNHWVVYGIDIDFSFIVNAVSNISEWGISPNPEHFHFTGRFGGIGGSSTLLPNGNLLVIFEGTPSSSTYGIWSRTFASESKSASSSDLGFLPGIKPLKSKIKKQGYISLKAKLKVANFGDARSTEATVRFYYSQDSTFDVDDTRLRSEPFVKPIKAAKSARKPKKKSVKANLTLPASSGYLVAEIVSLTESTSSNNIIILPFQPK